MEIVQLNKTAACIRRAARTGGVIVVANEQRREHVMRRAFLMDCRVICRSVAGINWFVGRDVSEIIIDDLDDVLSVLFRSPVGMVTWK